MKVLNLVKTFVTYLLKENSNIKFSLAFFRISFGLLMFGSTLRFILKGWVSEFYIKPSFHFTFYPFEFIKPFPEYGMNLVFFLILLSTVLIILGLFYRVSIIIFFLLFTYVELIDKTYYLNHYYFVSLLSFLLIFLPMSQMASLDRKFHLIKPRMTYNWQKSVIIFQVGLVYFMAGVAKLKYDWMFEALPLKIWLSEYNEIPIIGFLFSKSWVAHFASWLGAFFDLFITFVLLNKRLRVFGYFLVVIFHSLTFLFFHIGMFPLIMMMSALIFFESKTHEKWINSFINIKEFNANYSFSEIGLNKFLLKILFPIFFLFQILMPFRYLMYRGNFLYHEQGYRFSWNVMLMDKKGYCDFSIHNLTNDRNYVVSAYSVLTTQQARMMSTQPDMILQFANYLYEIEKKNGYEVEVFANCRVSVNKKTEQVLIDQNVNLAKQKEGFRNKSWIFSYY